MDRTGKEQRRRDRLREYDAQLQATRAAVGVLAQFARARESRAADGPLEAGFAATVVDGQAEPLPAAVWVALRQADVDAVVDILVHAATEQFLIAEHEQLDRDYRLTAVPECRGLPDLDRLIAQVAAFLRLPRDVLAVLAGWGPDDPRTHAEIDQLLDLRYGPPLPAQAAPAAPGPPRPVLLPPPATASAGPKARLTLSRTEFAAVLALTPEQHDVFAALTREADILIRADSEPG
jgi:hypothetical protein